MYHSWRLYYTKDKVINYKDCKEEESNLTDKRYSCGICKLKIRDDHPVSHSVFKREKE